MFYGLETREDRAAFRRCLDDLDRLTDVSYAADDLIALGRAVGFRSDERLQAAVRRALDQTKEPLLKAQFGSKLWRLHVVTWAARTALALPGDFVECGVFDGFTARVISDYVDLPSTGKTFFLYDTFEGLSAEYASAEELERNRFYHRYPDAHARCLARFEGVEGVRIVRGVVPDVLEREVPEAVSLLLLDMNCARAELGALRCLYARVPPGGLVVFDDYGKSAFAEQREVADSFMASRGASVLELPTGQGLVLKPPGEPPETGRTGP